MAFIKFNFNFYLVMSKDVIKRILLFVVKYVMPIVIGYLEGDSHIVQDSLSSIF